MSIGERWLIVLVAVLVTVVFVAAAYVAIRNLVGRRRARATHDRLNRLP